MKAPEPQGQTAPTGTQGALDFRYVLGVLLLVVFGCAAHATTAAHSERPTTRKVSSRSKSPDPVREAATATTARVSVRNGLPDTLSPLSTSPVRHLAFANDTALRSRSEAHAAGAVEDEAGVTICLVSGPLPSSSVIVHPSPFSSEAETHCVREDGARIARAARPIIGKVVEDISFVLTLELAQGTVRRAYAFGPDVRAKEAQVQNTPKRNRESVGKPPPWSRRLEDEIKLAAHSVRGHPRAALPNARTVTELKPIPAPSWSSLLRQNSELETRALVDDDAPVLALSFWRASFADSEPAREMLIAREGERWFASQALPEVFVQAARAPSLGPNVLLALTRALDGGPHASRRTLYADRAQMRILSVRGGELVEHAMVPLGEVGYTRLAVKNRVWRVFNQARVTQRGCLLVRRDHAFTALFDTRAAEVSERSRLKLGLEGLPPEVVTRYSKVEGKYHFDGEQLRRRKCP